MCWILVPTIFLNFAVAFLIQDSVQNSPREAHQSPLTSTFLVSARDPQRLCKLMATRTNERDVTLPNQPIVASAALLLDQYQDRQETFSQASVVLKLALAGSIATVISDMSMHPIDCIKTLQQSNEGIGLSIVQAAQFIYTELGGVPGFYKGFFTYAVCDATAGALKFSTYEVLKRQVKSMFPKEEQVLLLNAVLFVCAAVAFVASSVIAVPGELLKQQLQMGHYSSLFDAVTSIWESCGVLGYFAGYSGVFLRDVPYTALELGMYDLIKSLYLSRQTDASKTLKPSDEIMAAAITGGISGYITTPLDTIKTKMVVDSHDYLGGGFLDTLTSTIHDYGLSSLFAGGTARVAWLVPLTAIYLPTYDFLKRQWTVTDDDQ